MPDTAPDQRTVFAETLERTDPADRAAYLDVACGDDHVHPLNPVPLGDSAPPASLGIPG